MKNIKGPTAIQANKALGRNGQFWMTESYDHYIRDDHELDRIHTYILNNPIKADLVKDWKDWPFSYSKSGLE